MDNFTAVKIKEVINSVGKELERKGKQLFMPIRIAVSSQRSGGDLPTVIELYGKEQVISNINLSLECLDEN
jgi:nondiscriminating glutamyl-tRNA synthetase